MSSTGDSDSKKESSDVSGSSSSTNDNDSPTISAYQTPSLSNDSEDVASSAEKRMKSNKSRNALALALVINKDKKRKRSSPSLTLERRCGPRFSTGEPSTPLKKKHKSIAHRTSSMKAKKTDKAQQRKGKEICIIAHKKLAASKAQKCNKGKGVLIVSEDRPYQVVGRGSNGNTGKSVATVAEDRPTVISSRSHHLKMLTSRTCPAAFMSCINQLSEFQKDLIKEWGFGFLLACDLTKLPWRLSYFVVDKFDWITCSIKIPFLEDIRLIDGSVERYIGLPKGPVKLDDSKFKADPAVVTA